ncbi:MAG: hypothetical protein WKG00_38650 [Polyangiaceae bacterium]
MIASAWRRAHRAAASPSRPPCTRAAGAFVLLLLAVASPSCAQPTAPAAEADARGAASSSSRAAGPGAQGSGRPATSAADSPGAASASAAAAAASSTTAAPAASASAPPPPAAPEDPRNLTPPEPSAGPALQARAQALFDGVVADDPALAEPFWFPREPFTRLKAIDKPEKYWAQLHATYQADVHKLHRSRQSWQGARFLGYTPGSAPTWVKPGDEGNSIGYWRSFRGKVRFEQGGKEESFEVRVTITWQGAWHITHLLPFKK